MYLLCIVTYPNDPSIRSREVECQKISTDRKLDNPHAIDVEQLRCKRKMILKHHLFDWVWLPERIAKEPSCAIKSTSNGNSHASYAKNLRE